MVAYELVACIKKSVPEVPVLEAVGHWVHNGPVIIYSKRDQEWFSSPFLTFHPFLSENQFLGPQIDIMFLGIMKID